MPTWNVVEVLGHPHSREQQRERIPSVVSVSAFGRLVHLSDLESVVRQVVVNDEWSHISEHCIAVIPDTEEPQNLRYSQHIIPKMSMSSRKLIEPEADLGGGSILRYPFLVTGPKLF